MICAALPTFGLWIRLGARDASDLLVKALHDQARSGKSACRRPPRSYKDLDELRPICRDGLGSRNAKLSLGRGPIKSGGVSELSYCRPVAVGYLQGEFTMSD